MPQATRELQERWQHDDFMDAKAIEHLMPNFSLKSGWICRKDIDYSPTADDVSAINYLCQEWDYYWEGVCSDR